MNQLLLDAIEDGDLPRVEQALQNGADVNDNTLYVWGLAPLHLTCCRGHFAIVQYLVNHGANLEATDNSDGMTPLHYACENGHLDVVRYLLTRGANLEAADIWDRTPLYCVCCEGHLPVVQYLLTGHGANLEATDDNGATPLHMGLQVR